MAPRTPMPQMNALARTGTDRSAVDVLSQGIAGEIAALTYTGPQSVRDAKLIREKAMAMVELGRRAGVLGVDHLITARTAERGLGQMLDLGRRAGEIAGVGVQRSFGDGDISTLTDLGIHADLAADAAMLARLDDDEWATLTARARETETASRASLVTGAKQLIAYRTGRDLAKSDAKTRATKAAEAEAAAQRAAQAAAEELDRLLAAPYKPIQPTLAPEEIRVDGVGAEMSAAISTTVMRDAPRTAAQDASTEAQKFRATVEVMRSLTAALEQPAVLTDDVWTAVNVLGAREVVGRLSDAIAIWMRDLNQKWESAARM